MKLNSPSCVKRILATCATSQPSGPHVPLERNSDAEEITTLRQALEELSIEQRDLHHFLKERLGINRTQETPLLKTECEIDALKEAVLQALTAYDSKKDHEESSLLKEMKEQRVLLDALVNTTALHGSVVSEMQESLSKMKAHTDLYSMRRLQRKITKQEGSLSEIKEMLKNNQNRSLTLQETTPPKLPKNCADLLKRGDTVSGVRTVYPFICGKCNPIPVVCDQTTDGGGWIVFQHRDDLPKRIDFYLNWKEYRRGFGDFEGEFWLGLGNIRAFMLGQPMELRVDLEDFDGQKRWAKYEVFSIEDASAKYRLYLENYSGDAGDSLMARHSGMMFSTKDQDNDDDRGNCAEVRRGGWWYEDCTSSNLNGIPYKGQYDSFNLEGIYWNTFRGNQYSLKKTAMKMRPKVKK